MIELNRRQLLLSTTAVSGAAGLTGCLWTPSLPERQRLTFNRYEYRPADGAGTFRLEVVNEAPAEPEWAFEDVQVLAYDRAGQRVGDATVGKLPGDAQQFVEVECSDWPMLVTYDADPGPCDEDVEITVSQYIGYYQQKHQWGPAGTRVCGEELPPKPPETWTATPPQDRQG